MKIYLAGNSGNWEPWDLITDHGQCLQSYIYNAFESKVRHKKLMDKSKKTGKVDLFLDSGAFSAFTQGITIDIQDYIAFIKEHLEHLTVYANLDVIGDPAATLANQEIMEAAGLKPLPCFHYGDPVKYLKHYMKTHDYIALGGMVPISTGDLLVWLDDIFHSHICGKDGLPLVKVHGFGLTSFPLMKRYPWYSVDSTSWVMTGRMGSIYIPRRRGGEWIYSEDGWKVPVSSKSPSKSEAGAHVDTLSIAEKQVIIDYLEHKGYLLGKSEFRVESADYTLKENEYWDGKAVGDTRGVETIIERGVSNDYMLRDEVNIIYFMDLEKSMPKWPWAFKLCGTKKGFGL